MTPELPNSRSSPRQLASRTSRSPHPLSPGRLLQRCVDTSRRLAGSSAAAELPARKATAILSVKEVVTAGDNPASPCLKSRTTR